MVLRKAQIALVVALAVQQMMVEAAAQSTQNQADGEVAVVKVTGARSGSADYNQPTATSATKLDAPLRDIPRP